MHLFSTPVLLCAAVISSPALWSSFLGQAPAHLGLSRYLFAVALTWGALTLVATLIGPTRPRPSEAASHEQTEEPVTAPAPDATGV